MSVQTFSQSLRITSLFSDSRLEPIIAGQFISVGSLASNTNLPIDNPFIPAELLSAINQSAIDANIADVTEVTFRRRMVELGNRTRDVQRRIF